MTRKHGDYFISVVESQNPLLSLYQESPRTFFTVVETILREKLRQQMDLILECNKKSPDCYMWDDDIGPVHNPFYDELRLGAEEEAGQLIATLDAMEELR